MCNFSFHWKLMVNIFIAWGAAIAQWIRLHLPSCCPGFESQAHHLCFHKFVKKLCNVEKTKINKKRPRLAHLKKNIFIAKTLSFNSQWAESSSADFIQRWEKTALSVWFSPTKVSRLFCIKFWCTLYLKVIWLFPISLIKWYSPLYTQMIIS